MLKHLEIKIIFFVTVLISILIPSLSFASSENSAQNNKLTAVITSKIFERAKKNENWKLAFTTGKDAQVVFMSISPTTNPKNEIGMETHKFDQIIFVIEGKARSIIDGKISSIAAGDMIFIPQGTPHNFVNLNAYKPLKIISIYSATDMPANSTYMKKSNEPTE